jgi:hypothetical protein
LGLFRIAVRQNAKKRTAALVVASAAALTIVTG